MRVAAARLVGWSLYELRDGDDDDDPRAAPTDGYGGGVRAPWGAPSGDRRRRGAVRGDGEEGEEAAVARGAALGDGTAAALCERPRQEVAPLALPPTLREADPPSAGAARAERLQRRRRRKIGRRPGRPEDVAEAERASS